MDILHGIISAGEETITWWQMAIRAGILFFCGILLVRLGGKRIFGRNTAFDVVLAVILGSILSRSITGNAPFVPTLAAAAALVALHWIVTLVALGSHWFGYVVKGKERRLVADGRIDRAAMRRSGVTDRDLMEALRLKGYDDLRHVKAAFLERSGEISIIVRDQKPEPPDGAGG